MTNEPILKNEKMNINQLITTNYINSRPIGQKKTNPFFPDPPKPWRRRANPNACRVEASNEAGNPISI
jgi:hypothetical protein